MLNFIGRGSAFNHKDGNNAAFYIEDNKMLLIDCGETTFSRILEMNLLSNINRLDIFITHTHPDHIGSLGSLIFYFYFIKNKTINIVVDNFIKHKDSISKILELTGVKEKMFNFIDIDEISKEYEKIDKVEYIYTEHYEGLDSYGIIFFYKEKTIYYSGDTIDIENIKSILNVPETEKIYVDTTLDDFLGNPHLSLKILEENISIDKRNKIYCMHINSLECEESAKKLGFNVVDLYKKEDD